MDVEAIHIEAKRLRSCEFLTGNENFEELAEMLFTPQGIEFCKTHKFPKMDLLLPLKGDEAESKGIYINTRVEEKNINMIALFGPKTEAVLEFDKTEGFQVIVMHGARVKIIAREYAVVFLTSVGGHVELEITGNAKIL